MKRQAAVVRAALDLRFNGIAVEKVRLFNGFTLFSRRGQTSSSLLSPLLLAQETWCFVTAFFHHKNDRLSWLHATHDNG